VHLNYVRHGSNSKTKDALIDEVDILVRTYVLDIEQQNELIGCTSYLSIINFLNLGISLTINLPKKGLVLKMKSMIKLNSHPPSKLPLNRLKKCRVNMCKRFFHTRRP
jgi:hypothetical protein